MSMLFYLDEVIVTILPRSFSVKKCYTSSRYSKKEYPLIDKKVTKVLQEIQKEFLSSPMKFFITVSHESKIYYFQSVADFEEFMKQFI